MKTTFPYPTDIQTHSNLSHFKIQNKTISLLVLQKQTPVFLVKAITILPFSSPANFGVDWFMFRFHYSQFIRICLCSNHNGHKSFYKRKKKKHPKKQKTQRITLPIITFSPHSSQYFNALYKDVILVMISS